MPDTGNAKDYLELPPRTFSIFILKNVTWRTYLIIFTVQYCFLFRFVWIELVSLTWFLQIWVAIYVYGTMINWSTLIKKLMQTYIVKVSGSILNFFTIHLNGIWRLLWRYLSKPVLGGHPVLSGHYSISRGCPLNTGFTVLFCLVCQGVFGYFPTIPDNFRRFPKTTQNCRRRMSGDCHSSFELFLTNFSGAVDNAKRLRGFHEKTLQTLNIIFSGNSKQRKKKTR